MPSCLLFYFTLIFAIDCWLDVAAIDTIDLFMFMSNNSCLFFFIREHQSFSAVLSVRVFQEIKKQYEFCWHSSFR